MKLYPAYLISDEELAEAGIAPVEFRNGRLLHPDLTEAIEDYCGRPVVRVRQATRKGEGIIVIAADGYVQHNPLTRRRTAVLQGSFESLQVVLQDIFDEAPGVDPERIFRAYAYQVDVVIQKDLQEWVRNECVPAWKARMAAEGGQPRP